MKTVAKWIMKTIADAFDEVFKKYPRKTAFIFEDQKFTYQDMGEEAKAFTKGVEGGVKKEDKISLASISEQGNLSSPNHR